MSVRALHHRRAFVQGIPMHVSALPAVLNSVLQLSKQERQGSARKVTDQCCKLAYSHSEAKMCLPVLGGRSKLKPEPKPKHSDS